MKFLFAASLYFGPPFQSAPSQLRWRTLALLLSQAQEEDFIDLVANVLKKARLVPKGCKKF
jgi:hypothetical protein